MTDEEAGVAEMPAWEDFAHEAFGDDADRMIERIRRDADEEVARSRFAHELGMDEITYSLNRPTEIKGRFTDENMRRVRALYPLATINGEESPLLRRPV